MNGALEALRAARVIPIVREESATRAERLAHELLEAGARAIEITATTPEWPRITRAAAGNGATIGVGTLMSRDDAERALAAGAAFLVSPFPAPGVRAHAEQAEALFIEGGFSPGEIASAAIHGPAKLFPAHVGGISYLRSLLAILPNAQLIPTGGIEPDEAEEWLAAGAFAVGLGSGLNKLRDPAGWLHQVGRNQL